MCSGNSLGISSVSSFKIGNLCIISILIHIIASILLIIPRLNLFRSDTSSRIFLEGIYTSSKSSKISSLSVIANRESSNSVINICLYSCLLTFATDSVDNILKSCNCILHCKSIITMLRYPGSNFLKSVKRVGSTIYNFCNFFLRDCTCGLCIIASDRTDKNTNCSFISFNALTKTGIVICTDNTFQSINIRLCSICSRLCSSSITYALISNGKSISNLFIEACRSNTFGSSRTNFCNKTIYLTLQICNIRS